MATTATLFSLVGKPFPFIGIGPAAQMINAIPSAEFSFQLISGAITIAAAGLNQTVLVNCPLPRTFCYVLVECSVIINGVDADNWNQASLSFLQDSTTTPEVLIPVDISNEQLGQETEASFSRTYTLKDGPSKLIVPLNADFDARLQCSFSNIVIDGAVGVMHFYARFLRFDRNQSQFWAVNTPVLIR